MPVQLQRIFLVFLAFILIFLVVKHFLKDETFGEYGHYRGASLEENKRQAIKYLDPASCAECHLDIVDLKSEGLHNEVNCQICHGPANMHVDTLVYAKLDTPDSRDFCASCHNVLAGRPTFAVNQVDVKEHNTEDKCIKCHNPHEPWLELE